MPRASAQERVFFLFHGVHHAQPQLKTRLVMPPVVSIPLAVLFYGLFYLIVGVLLSGPHWVAPLFAGFIVGYLAYDMIHYATHHFPMRSGYLKYHQALSHGAPLQGAERASTASARRCGTTFSDTSQPNV